MKIAVVYASRTGNTRRAAELIGACFEDRGHEVSVRSAEEANFKALAEADLICAGTWVGGLIAFGHHPGDGRKLAQLPVFTGKDVAVFMTYAVHAGKVLDQFAALFRRQGAQVLGGQLFRRDRLPAGIEGFVDGLLTATTNRTPA